MPRGLALLGSLAVVAATKAPPNFAIVFGDDWGWGDLGANSALVAGLTPNLDKIAADGLRFTDFHVGASVCTPSRAALLTGRLGLRTGVIKNFGPSSLGGLPLNEMTIAEMLKTAPTPYRTGMVGKWHLGTYRDFFPTHRGFDSYVGVPYSIDMGCSAEPAITNWDPSQGKVVPCAACPVDPQPIIPGPPDHSCGRASGCISDIALPLFNNQTIVAQPVALTSLSESYAVEIERFIEVSAASGDPFFLYFAASHVHVPLNTAPEWVNKSGRSSPFADALMEFDHTVGRMTAALATAGVAENTLILVTGDNGPWACKCPGMLAGTPGPYVGTWQHSAGRLGSSTKMTVWEGGHRVVGLASFPGMIAPGMTTHALASSLDYMPTLANLSGAVLPSDRHFDGVSMAAFFGDTTRASLMHGNNGSLHTTLFHPLSGAGGSGPLDAMRFGNYKAHWTTGGATDCGHKNTGTLKHDPPLLFDLAADPAEANALDLSQPGLSAIVAKMIAARQAKVNDINNTLRSVVDYSSGPAGKAANCCDPENVVCRCDRELSSIPAFMLSPYTRE